VKVEKFKFYFILGEEIKKEKMDWSKLKDASFSGNYNFFVDVYCNQPRPTQLSDISVNAYSKSDK
jgi:hypothetical protein